MYLKLLFFLFQIFIAQVGSKVKLNCVVYICFIESSTTPQPNSITFSEPVGLPLQVCQYWRDCFQCLPTFADHGKLIATCMGCDQSSEKQPSFWSSSPFWRYTALEPFDTVFGKAFTTSFLSYFLLLRKHFSLAARESFLL